MGPDPRMPCHTIYICFKKNYALRLYIRCRFVTFSLWLFLPSCDVLLLFVLRCLGRALRHPKIYERIGKISLMQVITCEPVICQNKVTAQLQKNKI